jgi:gluconolactonase
MSRLRFLLALALAGAAGASATEPAPLATGGVHAESPALDALVDRDAAVERLGEGFGWAEGPVWIADGGYLLFTDVPGNRIHRWAPGEGVSVFLEPSGIPRAEAAGFREPGANGLIPGPAGTILMADHGHRAIARLDLATRQRTLLATRFQGRRFNSPNDLVRARSGAIYFTDPPYGLEGLDASPLREQPHNGVYRLDPDGNVTLIDASLSFPNGIALSPDQRTLYVANSDPARAIWIAYALDESGGVAGRRVFADVTAEVGEARPGLPDGLAIDEHGNLFATGPGGVIIFAPDGRRLGRIGTGKAIANCAFGGEDGRTLFLASHDMLARVRTRTRGLAE